ncbi:MAG: hypothetical protein M0Z66_14635 [Thermaerobacter sp.]|nr:hypothetical protein [Thermaerobacter sp.]
MLTLELPPLGPAEQELALNALANTLACALDEALLSRVGGFLWQDAQIEDQPDPPGAVPSNRYDRAALHLYVQICTPRRIIMPREEAQHLMDLLDDCLKVASRLHGGRLWPMMQESIWRRLRDTLQEDLAKDG